jgi:predicted unusual protein kinase regulating ubiquinone biosynthesis (AarF/ABC1/UbiB family)
MIPRLRFLKAYRTALIVLGSYFLLSIRKKIAGKRRMPEKIAAVHRRNARRIEKTILELKGLFIKVGQMLSIMSNFLPETLTAGLEGLQDSVPPHPYEAIEKRFVEEFGETPETLFAHFEKTPIASASLGQVHVAKLKDGTKAAVKVQYPEIDEIVREDLKILKRIFSLLDLFFPVYGLKSVYEEISEVVTRELDYVYEGQNLETIRKNFEKEPDILFPDVFWNLSTSKILTLRFMEGIKISAVAELEKNGIDRTEVATKIIHAYCKQIFIDGVYHADPHPGNLLVQKGEEGTKIILVDFGATATISEKMRNGITLFAEGLIKRDTKKLANAMREMGFVAREDSFEPFEELVDYFYEKLSNLKIENFRSLDLKQFHNLDDILEIRKIKISFKDLMTSFHVPKDWILLERAMLLTMGLCAHLAPKLNPIEIVLPYVEKFVLRDQTFMEVATSLLKDIALSYLQLPHEIHRTLKRLNEGSLVVGVKGQAEHTQRIYILGHQILYALLSVSSFFLSAWWTSGGFESYGKYALYGGLFFGTVLAGSVFKNRSPRS